MANDMSGTGGLVSELQSFGPSVAAKTAYDIPSAGGVGSENRLWRSFIVEETLTVSRKKILRRAWAYKSLFDFIKQHRTSWTQEVDRSTLGARNKVVCSQVKA